MKLINICLIACLLASITWSALHADPAQTAEEAGLMVGSPPPSGKIVTIDNFLQAPYNRWSLMHMRELVPTRAVPRGRQQAKIPRKLIDLSGLEVDLGDGRTVTVGDWLEAAYTDGFIVLQDGNMVFEQYYNGYAAGMQHLMFSVTKSLTGTMMLMLMEEGLVDGNATVGSYLPELADTAFSDATVQQMLDMTNSIEYNEEYYDPDADITRYLEAVLPGGEGLYSNLQGLKKKDPKFKHGEAFHYVTPVPEVLGWIIRRVSGQKLSQVLSRLIWSKLGAGQEAYYWLDPHGVEMAGAGLAISLRDSARFGQMILQDGKYNGKQVISTAIARRIKRQRNAELFNRYYNDPWYEKVAASYHDQWWGYAAVNAVAALGIHGQFIYINPAARVVIAKQSSDPDAESDRVDNETPMIMHAISAYLAAEHNGL
ncbi:serine hydrolase domain-containing protein [Pseudomonadota bacterium]